MQTSKTTGAAWIISLFLFIGISVSVYGFLTGTENSVGTVPTQWRVIWTADPATQATISWTTAERGNKHIVRYESSEGDKGSVSSHRDGLYTGGNSYYHHVRLTELQPGTKYSIVIESDGEKSRKMFFKTAPASDEAIKIIFGGDSRSSQENRRKMNQMIAKTVLKDQSVLALAHGGDYIGNGRKFEDWTRWLSDHELTRTSELQLVPIIPTRGNHDSGPLFNEIFDSPGGETNYYACNIGPQVRWVTLNSEIAATGDQSKWLEDELTKSREKNRWVLAQYHRPAYPAVKKPGSALKAWVPIFEKYNLDIACEADGHAMKRTMAIRDGKPDKTGVVYIGEGGLGVKQRAPDKSRWYLQEPGFAGSAHHFQLLSFDGKNLSCQTIELGGEVVDAIDLQARN